MDGKRAISGAITIAKLCIGVLLIAAPILTSNYWLTLDSTVVDNIFMGVLMGFFLPIIGPFLGVWLLVDVADKQWNFEEGGIYGLAMIVGVLLFACWPIYHYGTSVFDNDERREVLLSERYEFVNAHYRSDGLLIAQKALDATEVDWDSTRAFTKPVCRLNYDDGKDSYKDYRPSGWKAFPSEADQFASFTSLLYSFANSDVLRTQIETLLEPMPVLPALKCNSVVVAVEGWEYSGQSIQLDVGSLPEVLNYIELYVLDVARMERVKVPGKSYGPRPDAPAGGPGIKYYSGPVFGSGASSRELYEQIRFVEM